MKKLLTAIVGLSICMGQLWAGELTYTATFNVSDLKFSKINGYDFASLPGAVTTGVPGAPALPAIFQTLLIPSGSKVTGVDIVSVQKSEISGIYNILPLQPLKEISDTTTSSFTLPDPAFYNLSTAYPVNKVLFSGNGNISGYSLANFVISPLQYIPSQGKLIFNNSITYKITYSESPTLSVSTEKQKNVFGNIVNNLVANAYDRSRFAPIVSTNLSKGILPIGEYEYLIITQQPLDTVMQRLADWKKIKGISAKIVTTDFVYGNYLGADDAEKIRNFIIDARNTWGVINVLLAGDGDNTNWIIPTRYAWIHIDAKGSPDPGEEHGRNIPCDLYYSDLDGTWDTNNEGYYGEIGFDGSMIDIVDMYPDVFVGRAPIDNIADAQNIVHKIITYELTQPANYLNKVLLVSPWVGDNFYDSYGLITSNNIKDAFPASWHRRTLYQYENTLSQQAFIDSINAGFGITHVFSHGSDISGFLWKPNLSDPNATSLLRPEDTGKLNNGDRSGIISSIACHVNAWDKGSNGDCFAEELLNKVGGGYSAAIMNTRSGWGGTEYSGVLGPSPELDTAIFHLLWKDDLYSHIGVNLFTAKARLTPIAATNKYYRFCLYELSLMGDPTMQIWAETAPHFSFQTSPDSLILNQDNAVALKALYDGIPVAGLLTKAFINGALLAEKYTDASGNVSFAIKPLKKEDAVYVKAYYNNVQIYQQHLGVYGHPLATLRAISVVTPALAWTVGDSGNIRRIQSDVISSINITNIAGFEQVKWDFKGVSFTDANNGWVVGYKNTDADKYKGIILRTVDGGNNWVIPIYSTNILGLQSTSDSLTPFLKVKISKPSTYYQGYISCGNGWILKLLNDGTWEARRPVDKTAPSADTLSNWYQGLWMNKENPNEIWLSGDLSCKYMGSSDGGANWQSTTSTAFNQAYSWPPNTMFDYDPQLANNGIYCRDYNNPIAMLSYGNIGKFNGGWTVNNIAPQPMWLYGADSNLVCGSEGVIADTNGGIIYSETGMTFYDVTSWRGPMPGCADTTAIYAVAVGEDCRIIKHEPFLYYEMWDYGVSNSYSDYIMVNFMVGTENEDIIDRYEIYRSTSEINYGERIAIIEEQGLGEYLYKDYDLRYNSPYYYFLRIVVNDKSDWVFLGAGRATGLPSVIPLEKPANITVSDLPDDQGSCIKLNWTSLPNSVGEYATGFYIARKKADESYYKPLGYTTYTSFLDRTAKDGIQYQYAVAGYQFLSDRSSAIVGSNLCVALDNIKPNSLATPSGFYDAGVKCMTLNWNPSNEPNLGGYWVCPEPVGVFAEKISGIDPGDYQPDAYHVSHASPIDRTQWKWRVPDELVGQTLIFSVTAMDRSGNIASWSDQVFINTKALTNSNTAMATAYNNGRHLLYDDKGRLFLVYTSEDSVLYQQSWDDGYTWTPSSGFASGGIKPVPVIGYYGADTTMTWKAETENSGWILQSAKRVGNGWGPAETILEAIGTWEQTHYVSPPSMAINNAGTHLTIERVDARYQIGGQSGIWYWKLLYGFKAAGQTDYSWTVLDSTSGSWGGQDPNLASPTICLDSKGGVHIAWDYEGEIYWRGYDPYLGAWKDKTNLTNSPEVFSAEPSLSFYGDVHLVWQEGNDIQHRKGNWGYPRLENTIDAITKSFYWQGVENVSNTPTTASLNPVYDGNYVAWSEETAPGQYSARYSNYVDYTWQTFIDYSNNPSQPAVYPQIAYRQNVDGNKMTTIWTEGTGPLYSLIARDAAGQVTAQATTDVGGEEASLYLIERDGYIVYGASDAVASPGIITVDYDSTALEYYLPTLDRDQKQTMKFTFYQEYPGKIDYIYQVWVDNVSLGTVKVPSGQSVVFEKDLPNAVTHDGEGIIRIVNLKKDKIVTCDKWELYAYDKATGQGGPKKSGGVQVASSDSKPLAYVYALAQNAPNPFGQMTNIKYQIAKPGNVSLKIYNTLGQLVNTLVDGQQQPGIYSASWNGKDNSGRTAANGVYIYRLESGDFKATRKMVVVK